MPATLHRWDDIVPEQITPAISRRYVTGDGVTIARFELTRGGVVPMHSHPNEQLSYVLSGTLEYRFADRVFVAGAGEMLQIPNGLAHEVTALEDTIVVDVFEPIRQDWLNRTDTYFRGSPSNG
ncbi:MAG TPA: cupin domain-containing protein [Gemmatimonadaceae bacterium]|jgi:quercetin dioxygenase-like cupin family protein